MCPGFSCCYGHDDKDVQVNVLKSRQELNKIAQALLADENARDEILTKTGFKYSGVNEGVTQPGFDIIQIVTDNSCSSDFCRFKHKYLMDLIDCNAYQPCEEYHYPEDMTIFKLLDRTPKERLPAEWTLPNQ
ncbi:Oidioi.mRNA.OKI2018_I69.PAR.g12706.t1.cds [Oikopleura dioica]|uniref:Oidioi.mRNA.OKI2018_I69.PAR.g12706.t1.cds n=1 Tax=Oikopleura dioica TaxID=34765 RepID=A0ABN7S1A0_OIKDI|nr:Oidioi.mRNA.OKI2018_I69.PAR.g12706.t1.cds [Oikopleura dioica]